MQEHLQEFAVAVSSGISSCRSGLRYLVQIVLWKVLSVVLYSCMGCTQAPKAMKSLHLTLPQACTPNAEFNADAAAGDISRPHWPFLSSSPGRLYISRSFTFCCTPFSITFTEKLSSRPLFPFYTSTSPHAQLFEYTSSLWPSYVFFHLLHKYILFLILYFLKLPSSINLLYFFGKFSTSFCTLYLFSKSIYFFSMVQSHE
jgi:hypothetical protein